MPLIHGKSKEAFSQNVKTEMDSGKPQKQSLAIAYSEKRKADARRKMWRGGEVPPIEMSEKDVEEDYEDHSNHVHNEFCPEGCEWGDDEEISK